MGGVGTGIDAAVNPPGGWVGCYLVISIQSLSIGTVKHATFFSRRSDPLWDESKAARVAEGIILPWFKGILQTDGGSETACFLKGGKARLKPPPASRAPPAGACPAGKNLPSNLPFVRVHIFHYLFVLFIISIKSFILSWLTLVGIN